MTATRSEQMRAESRTALEKYDYYLLGVSAAACAYAVDRWTPQVFGFNESTVRCISIVCLFTAIIAAMQRIKSCIANKVASSAQMHAQECQQALPSQPPEKQSHVVATQRQPGLTQADLWRDAFRMAEVDAAQKAAAHADTSMWASVVRDVAILTGVALLALSKLVPLFCHIDGN